MAIMKHQIPFMKMHGLGNDFVIVDSRISPIQISAQIAQGLGDRHRGVGFDQLAVINDSSDADVALSFYNSDGSTAAACGNATRCIAQYEMDRLQVDSLSMITERGLLAAQRYGDMVSVNMGHPMLDWDKIPLARPLDTLRLPLDGAPTATGMGNPHCTFFVENAEAVDLAQLGPIFENDPLFPERTNVQFAHVVGKNLLRMRVWERGVGMTLASGSSSCATAVAAVRLGLTGRKVEIQLDGGMIYIDWRDDGVWMTGATLHVFDGVLTTQFLESLR
ncbi:MAG: diaminopimelate epimerase [Planktomarina sp.]|jgi:diaminopimelate epimerase|nr:diaminopimelate epimerase [Planktomarina sp.]MDT2057648.1 diaminopimelate epimerase [Planktomarina sp.]MDT2072905.1 diaminopimelate epimerase [Planktomarina sp.]|tara:strand:+ start:39 stop:869 length:831 start_codon:yes stop_codon:yes gene_type:complete